jgi:cbb3-type cytochrome oxidase subunit 3
MHWRSLPFPPGYEPPGISFLAAMLAIVLVFVAYVLWVASVSARLARESEREGNLISSDNAPDTPSHAGMPQSPVDT